MPLHRQGGAEGRDVVTASDDSVVGREPELAVLEEFLGGRTALAALLFTGGPGIGKTALWERGLSLARERGFRVLAARPSGTEAELSSAAPGQERAPAPAPAGSMPLARVRSRLRPRARSINPPGGSPV